MSIRNIVKAIQDIMRKDVGVDGDAQRLSQLVWMLFLKLFDDREKELDALDDNYKSPIPEHLRWRNWAENDEGDTGDKLIKFINDELFEGLRKLHNPHDERAFIIREIFEDSYNYMKSGQLVRQVINKINEIDFTTKNEQHEFNQVYENLLSSLQSAGNAGEYYTPRAITKFMVDVINPRLGEKILDPACGTGGFLTFVIKHLLEQVNSVDAQKLLQNTIYGVEKKPLPHQLCVTNMIINGIDVPKHILRDNSLNKPTNEIVEKNRVDIILTNPPFGGTEEEGVESNFPKSFRTRETADLFLYYIITKLKNGGRAAIVLPDGSLFGEGGVKTAIKKELLEKCNLHTIIRLPNGVFNPYTGIRTNLFFFDKGTPTKEIWYFEHPLPEGVKNYSRTNPLSDEEFEIHEKPWWNKRVENEYAWKVSIEDIKDRNYNLDVKNPYNVLKEPKLNKNQIIEKLKQNNNRINELLELLS